MVTDHSKPLESLTFSIDETRTGKRLDTVLSELIPHRSRTWFRDRIRKGRVSVNGLSCRPSHKVKWGDTLVVRVDPNPSWVDPLTIPVTVLHEDTNLVVLNKTPGQLIHPVGEVQGGTLINALHARHLEQGGSTDNLPQVVHRLDADTSGVVVFAKGPEAAAHYGQVFEKRQSRKIYLTLLDGCLNETRVVEAPLGDDTNHAVHVRQWVRADGKAAKSTFTPLAFDTAKTLCAVCIETGRLHQIRVHASYMGFPVMGDALYNNRDEDFARWIECSEPHIQPGRPGRQLLHAAHLELPALGGGLHVFRAECPDDFFRAASDLVTPWVAEGSPLPTFENRP